MSALVRKFSILISLLAISWLGVVAQHGWTVVTYSNSTTAYGVVTINGSPASAGDVVGAFVGNECRAFQEVVLNSGTAYVTLVVQGVAAEVVSFKVWDSSANSILNVSYTTQTNPGGIIGLPVYLPIAAATGPSISVSPVSQSVANSSGSTTFNVSNSGGGSMTWSAAITSGGSWASITSGASGTNSGTIMVTYAANTTCSSRSASITITAAGATGSPVIVTVDQAAGSTPIITVTPVSRSVANTAGTTTFDVSNTGCGTMAWTAAVTAGGAWASITGGASGTNSGTITITYLANTTCSSRSASITLTSAGATGSPKVITVDQAAGSTPTLTLTPTSRSVGNTSGTTTFDVSNTGCGSMVWGAAVTSGGSWASITSGASGTNSGTIMVTYAANTTCSSRSASITITAAGATGSPVIVTVDQAAGSTPIITVTPVSRSVANTAGTTTFDVSNTGCGTMAWTAAVTAGGAWASITGGASGTNSGTITITYLANTTCSSRSASITLTSAGATGSPKVITVDQAAGSTPTLTLTPTSRSVGNTSGTTTFDVSNTGCGSMVWGAAVTSGGSWATITSGTSGTNSGTITVTYAANTTCSSRSASITITAAGATGSPVVVTVDQAAGTTPTLTVTPTSRSVTNASGTTTFAVSNTGCGSMNWTAVVTAGGTWATITSGSSGTNSGTITVSYTANSTCSTRSASITITSAGANGSPVVVTVDQSANTTPVLAVTPANRSVGNPSGTTTFEVSNTGCGSMAWTAAVTTGGTWASITSGSSGTNTGTISISYTANTTCSSRSASITITSAGATGSPIVITIIQDGISAPILTLTPTSRSVTNLAGTTTFAVSNTGCGSMAWTAAVTTGGTWASITSGSSGTNSGTITVTYTANSSCSTRSASITIISAGATGSPVVVTVDQAANSAPVLLVNPTSRSVANAAGSTTIDVSNTGCGSMLWTASVTSGASWLTIANGSSGTNTGTITVLYTANGDCSSRSGSITITAPSATGSPRVVVIDQLAGSPILSVSPTTLNATRISGTGSFNVTNLGCGSMPWTATVTEGGNWCSIVSGSSGTNSGAINISYTANTDCSARSATISVSASGSSGSPVLIIINQEIGATPVLSVSPSNKSLNSASGTTGFTVTNAGCGTMTWSAQITTDSPWITIISGASGTNSGNINLSYSENRGCSPRSATLTVTSPNSGGSPVNITIDQAGGTIHQLVVSPLSRSVDNSAGNTTFTINNSGCGTMVWIASIAVGSEWAWISSGQTGTNNGQIVVNFLKNETCVPRSALLTISAPGSEPLFINVSIDQEPQNTPILTIPQDHFNVNYSQGILNVQVQNSGCGMLTWTSQVIDGASWLSIQEGLAGTNNGTVKIGYSTTCATRQGKIRITPTDPGLPPKEIFISQQADFNLSLDLTHVGGNHVLYGLDKTSFNIDISGHENLNWVAEITKGEEWLSLKSGSTWEPANTISGSGPKLLACNVLVNNNESVREATIKLTSLCSGASKIITINQGGTFAPFDRKSFNVLVYPNPVSSYVYIKSDLGLMPPADYLLKDTMGKTYKYGKINDETTLIDLSSIKPGIYFIQIITKTGLLKTFKISKH